MEKMGEVIYDVVALFKSALLACAHSGALQIGKYIHDQVNNTKVKTKIDEVKYRSKPQWSLEVIVMLTVRRASPNLLRKDIE